MNPTTRTIARNQKEIEKGNGVIVFYSYETPVAVFVPDKGALCTNEYHSRTTNKHINTAVGRWGATRLDVDPEVIAQYV